MSHVHGAEERIHVLQGASYVTDSQNVMLSTILGSCVAVCMRDPVAGVGGMNHFLLPEPKSLEVKTDSQIYGVHLMELLINGLLNLGARRHNLEAKVFGGATVVRGLGDIGTRNIKFALDFLKTEKVKIGGGNYGGDYGRKIRFWPVHGWVRQKIVSRKEVIPSNVMTICPEKISSGDVELF